ncbi:MAG: hypothetical protein JEZ04_16195 [Spirochaetales bacterium]|nr:hypothetical protein [Spirochaetales bacterium]
MKKLLILLTALILLASCATINDTDTVIEDIAWSTVELLQDYEGYTLAVYDFNSEDDDELVSYISQTLTVEIANAAMYEEVDIAVLSRKNINELMKEQAFQMSEITDTDSQVEFGRLLGADLIMTGSLSWEDEDVCSLNIQIIEVESGIIVGGFSEDFYVGK